MPNIQWGSISTSRILPAGNYDLKIDKTELATNQFNGCLQLNVVLRVVAPGQPSDGKAHTEFLQLGKTPFKTIKEEWPDDFKEFAAVDDPNFEDPRVQQRSRELKTFKRMLECAGFKFPAEASLEEVVAAAPGHIFTGHMNVVVMEYGKRAGEEKNVLDGIFPRGMVPTDDKASKSKVTKPSARSAGSAIRPKPQMSQPVAAEPVQFLDDEDE